MLLRIFLSLLLTLGLSASVSGTAAEINLKLHHFLGPTAPAHTHILVPWVSRIEQATDNRVAIEIFPSMTLGGRPSQLVTQVRDGVVDLIWTANGYTPGLFIRTEVFELPFIHTNDPVATNLAMRELFAEYLAEDYRQIKNLYIHVHQGQAIQTVDLPVHKPEDLRGTKLRIPTRTGAWVIEALGAAPTAMPVPDLPQALSKKVVDGALIPFEIIPTLQLQDLTEYQIEGHNQTRFGTTVFQLSMNLATWNSLPTDIQQVFIDQSGEEWLRHVGEVWAQSDAEGIVVATAAGNVHTVLTEQETDTFQIALEPVIERWIADVNEKGVDGEELARKARTAVQKHTN